MDPGIEGIPQRSLKILQSESSPPPAKTYWNVAKCQRIPQRIPRGSCKHHERSERIVLEKKSHKDPRKTLRLIGQAKSFDRINNAVELSVEWHSETKDDRRSCGCGWDPSQTSNDPSKILDNLWENLPKKTAKKDRFWSLSGSLRSFSGSVEIPGRPQGIGKNPIGHWSKPILQGSYDQMNEFTTQWNDSVTNKWIIVIKRTLIT